MRASLLPGWLASAKLRRVVTNRQLIKTKYGDAAQNPLVSIARKHAGDMVRYASEFGLTALARSRLAAGTNAPPPHGGKFAGLLGYAGVSTTVFDGTRKIGTKTSGTSSPFSASAA